MSLGAKGLNLSHVNIQCLHIDTALTSAENTLFLHFECVTELCDAKISGTLNNLGMLYFCHSCLNKMPVTKQCGDSCSNNLGDGRRGSVCSWWLVVHFILPIDLCRKSPYTPLHCG